jgi:raffinose/stachyose/melibiose transport system permease protein
VKKKTRLTAGKIGFALIIICFVLVFLVPLLTVVNVSLKSKMEYMNDPVALPVTLHFDNFAKAWTKANFPQYLFNSIFYTLSATVIFVLSGVFVAFPLARKYIRGHGFIQTLFIMALFLPGALIPQFSLILNLHLYNNQFGYILLFTTNAAGILILVNYLKSIPRELDEAAAIDGCGYFRFVIRIILPLIKPALATVVVLHAIGAWNEIILPTIYLINKAYYPVTRGLMAFYGQFGQDWTLIAAALIIMMLPLLLLFVALQKYFISGALQGSVKA